MDTRDRGRWGEDAVEQWLVGEGFCVEARNLRLQRGEIDLIARQGDRLWFVEVKARSRGSRRSNFRAVDRRKRLALFAAAREYLLRIDWRWDYGFLVASVLPNPGDGSPRVRCTILPMTPGSAEGER